MTAKDMITNGMNMSHMVLTTYLGDLTDADLMVRSVPGTNHIAWQLGHLIVSENKMLTDAGCRMPDLPDGFAESYTKESSASDDAGKFHTKEQYLTWMAEQREGTMAALAATPDEDLGKATPEPMHAYAATMGAAFNMIGVQVLMHVGQFVPVRRKQGKPVTI